ncbi:FixH family protein [Sphingomonas sp. MMS12-HWE2-04]|uniref:FixH family protein n=1 Tax=Sphingomonas sp. MMS12-HWE2-04 TaxID=3234199 RepID=UPI00384A8162
MTQRFTGWHMFGILVGMFGIIIAVNFVMARAAIRTFGGTVVDNSYVASQHYNRWLAEARAQKALGWTATTSLDPARHVAIASNAPANALVTATVHHPLGREADRGLTFVHKDGRFLSSAPIPQGRWQLRITVQGGGHVARFEEDLQ